jgi:hypothetical protein
MEVNSQLLSLQTLNDKLRLESTFLQKTIESSAPALISAVAGFD